jgi:putative addiction module killer protein
MTDTGRPKEAIVYRDSNGREPYTEWLYALRDHIGIGCIWKRIEKLKQGAYGDCERLGGGVIELKIDSGPGYRVYVGEHKNKIVVLLGGEKHRQEKDIQRARALWKEYKDHEKL